METMQHVVGRGEMSSAMPRGWCFLQRSGRSGRLSTLSPCGGLVRCDKLQHCYRMNVGKKWSQRVPVSHGLSVTHRARVASYSACELTGHACVGGQPHSVVSFAHLQRL